MRYALCLLLMACASQPTPAREPTPEPTPAPTPEPTPAPAPEPAPTQAPVKGYEACPLLHVIGEPAPRGNPPKLTAWRLGALDTYPDPICAPVDAWAGVSAETWGLAGGFAGDSTVYLHCGNGTPACALIDVATAATTRQYKVKTSSDTKPDGIFTDPTIKRAVSFYKIGASPAEWAAPDVFVVWSVATTSDTIVYALRERTTGAEVELATFSAAASDVPTVILPEAAVLSPNGKTIALRAITQAGQNLTAEVKLVRVNDALKRLYAAAALKDPANADTWNSKL